MKSSRSVTALLMKGFRSFPDILYPRRCPLCHQILKDPSRLICPACAKEIRPISEPRCFKCGKPVKEEEEYCVDCRIHPGAFRQGKGIFLYDSRMKDSLMKYKYYGRREYGRFFARAMYIYGKKDLERWKPDLLIPVPLYWRKQRMRGFNQAAYLAEQLSGYTGIPADCSLVKKVRQTKSQKKLDAAGRRKNLQAAFRVRERVDGRRILVVDDVYTTGSTMDAMASCLLENGAEEIFFLTLCMGQSR
ncbi:double zinc ribbon domain-containing protein [Ruminococcus sp. 5_1_39BFAA]|uniref:double zinc ribbon domain-containing protein n=1 Tax=Ruminococcus sp. 5_1_39BFAA TaxID=457412 RepID=UPI0035673814